MLLGAAGILDVVLLDDGNRLVLGEATEFVDVPSAITLSRAWGLVRTGLETGIGLWFMGESASGSGSSVIDTPFPFFLVAKGVTKSRLAELLVLQVLLLRLLSPAEGTDELIVRSKESICWQPPSLNGGS